jgi:hypothetical protein
MHTTAQSKHFPHPTSKHLIQFTNKPVAIVTAVNHFLGINLARQLLRQHIKVIGIPYLFQTEKSVPHQLRTHPDFHYLHLHDFTSIKLSAKSLGLISSDFQYLFLTDLYAASHSLLPLDSRQLSRLLKFQLSMLPLELDTNCKISLLLPYFNIQQPQPPFPFNNFHLPRFLQQLEPLQKNRLNFRTIQLIDCYGPHLPLDSTQPLSKFFHALQIEKNAHLVLSTSVLLPLYISDAVKAIVKASIVPGLQSQKMLLAGPSPISSTALLPLLQQTIGNLKHIKISVSPPDSPANYNLQLISQTRRLLHWRPRVYFDQGLVLTLKFLAPHLLTTPLSVGRAARSVKFSQIAHPVRILKTTLINQIRQLVIFFLTHLKKRKPSPHRLGVSFSPRNSLLLIKLALALAIFLLIFLPPVFFGFFIIQGTLGFKNSLSHLHFNQLNYSIQQSRFARQNFDMAGRILGYADATANLLPFLHTAVGFLQHQLDMAEAASAALNSSSITLESLHQLLLLTLDQTSSTDPRVPLNQSLLYLNQAGDRLAYLQTILPARRPISLYPFITEQDYQKVVSGLPTLRQALVTLQTSLSMYPDMAGFRQPQSYLVLFQNNRELRPTGGFIGSFALLNFKQGKLADWRIYDVYDADGQLLGHVEPPGPIKKYLESDGGWYLRDANWDPHFPASAEKIEWFLGKELHQSVEGVIAVDFDLIQNLISDIGSLNLPELQTTVTSENFYQQAQQQAENNFFPGSHQKRDFLSSVTDALLFQIRQAESIDYRTIAKTLYKGLEKKQVQVYLNYSPAQKIIADYGWDGSIRVGESDSIVAGVSTIKKKPLAAEFPDILSDFSFDSVLEVDLPAVASPADGVRTEDWVSASDIRDRLFLVEANLGVNKVNQFINRQIQHHIDLSTPNQIKETLNIFYTNASTEQDRFGGSYKNYLRLYLPRGTRLDSIKIGEADIIHPCLTQTERLCGEEASDQSVGRSENGGLLSLDPDFIDASQEHGWEVYGFLVNIPPNSRYLVQAGYTLPHNLTNQNKIDYQLTLLKQAGILDSTYQFTLQYPPNFHPTNGRQDGVDSSNSTLQILTSSQTLRYNLNLSTDQQINLSLIKDKIKSL